MADGPAEVAFDSLLERLTHLQLNHLPLRPNDMSPIPSGPYEDDFGQLGIEKRLTAMVSDCCSPHCSLDCLLSSPGEPVPL